jgi:hypothetical protein
MNITKRELYLKYIEEDRSLILDNWEQADILIDYMKSINHKIVGKLTSGHCKSMGKDCVHVCEALYFPEGGFK